ncbi:MAG: hypothetical protein INR65_15545 [Gluconacetobacter diazotrophicus]|nr:hypothetical protein [Gluconacetobacter diazotrophicus]
MKTFTSHFPPAGTVDPEKPPLLVPDGFAPSGLLFGWLSLARPRFLLVGTLCLAATLCCLLLARRFGLGAALIPPLHLAIGAFANDWRRWELRRAGWTEGPLAFGADRVAALRQLLSAHPGLLRPAAGTAS